MRMLSDEEHASLSPARLTDDPLKTGYERRGREPSNLRYGYVVPS